MMNTYLKNTIPKIELKLLNSPKRHLYSPISYAHKKVTEPLVKRYAFGKLIDLGCGLMPYRELIIDQVEQYDSLDLFPRVQDVTYKLDIQDMNVISDNYYDTILCIEVLEHIPNPFRAFQEIARILKPDGLLILSVPHLSRLHDEPYDFYRFTKYGLKYLCELCGMEVVELKSRGGLLTFLGHQLSTTLLGLTWSIPVVKSVFWFFNSWLITRPFFYFDKLINPGGIFTQGYTIVSRKLPLR